MKSNVKVTQSTLAAQAEELLRIKAGKAHHMYTI
jgi:hypothetical protein